MDATAQPQRIQVELDDDSVDFAADLDEIRALRQYEREYHAAMLVIGVLVERLLSVTGGDAVEIADTALTGAPRLRAWRDSDRASVSIAVE